MCRVSRATRRKDEVSMICRLEKQKGLVNAAMNQENAACGCYEAEKGPYVMEGSTIFEKDKHA